MEMSQEANARRQRERRARIAAATIHHPDGRLCLSCGKPNPDDRYRNCLACRVRTRSTRSNIVAKGLCCICQQPSRYGIYCHACNEERAQAALRRQQAQILTPYRAIMILDQSTQHLGERLHHLAFHTFLLDLAASNEQREAFLAHRTLVTTRPDQYRFLAAKARAVIIDVSELDDEKIPAAIDQHVRVLRLVGKAHLLLKLKKDGESCLEPLVSSYMAKSDFAPEFPD